MGSDQATMNVITLFLTCLTACLLCIDSTGRLSFHWLTASVLTAFIITYPTSYLPQWLRRGTQLIIGETFIFICLVDCYCQEIFFTPITPQVLSNVLLSNVREANEFFSTFIGYHVLWHWRISTLLILAIALPPLLFFLRKPLFLHDTVKYAMMALLGLCLICEAPATYRYSLLFFQGQDLQEMEGLVFRHYHEEIPTPIHRMAFASYSLRISSRMLSSIKHSTFSAKPDSCSYRSPHIVLIIGESYNKHHAEIYGYSKATTPLQKQRMKNGELFVFNDIMTPWNITSNVFLEIFSLWENGMKETTSSMPLFPMLFRRAGYTVNFFSNQYLLRGWRRGSTNQTGHFFLADAEMSDSLFSYRNRKHRKFDMGLVEQVADYKMTKAPSDYTLDIIHLIGQHFDYSLRYPHSTAKFTLNDYADRNLSTESKEIVMHYDNATHYNDMVLDSLLCLYKQENAIVVFVADHGEEVYDELPVHGRLFQEPTAAQARQEFEVPMWIWCSASYRNYHPDIVKRIELSVRKPFMTDGIPQLLLYLAGISSKWNDDSRNLLSPNYRCKKRVICGSTAL